MIAIGVDYGDKYIGLALKAADVSVAVPFGEIERVDDKQVAQKLATLAADAGADVVVVGMPDHMSGDPSEQSKKTEQFINVLQQYTAVKIETMSEILTSKQAADMEYPHASIHEKSAVLILEDWLSS